jgi:GMP synthase-like glutamine amidotransferase
VIQHEASAPGGYLNDWLVERGAEVDVLHIYADERDVDPARYDLIVPLGSEQHAYDDAVPWLARELALVRGAAALEVPTFGICFGGQLLARALGGSVVRAPVAEIGWLDVRTNDTELIAPGPWFQWHFDAFRPPPHALVHAESDVGPQAFELGRAIGLQFHPEVTAEIVGMWAAESPGELRAEGVDPDALMRETRAGEPQSRAAAWRLFDALLSRLTADGSDRR